MANEPELTDNQIREVHDGISSMLNGNSGNELNVAEIGIANEYLNQQRSIKPLNERLIQQQMADQRFDLETVGTGEVRPSDEGNLWLSQLSTETAAESLRLAFMMKNPGMQAREVGKAADLKMMEFYTEAAQNTAYEVDRLEYVQQKAKNLANDMKGGK